MCSIDPKEGLSGSLIGEIQIILAEKRTSLSFLRTGIALLALPLSLLSILIVTSKYYDFAQVIHLVIPLLVLCTLLVVLGFYLVVRAVMRVRHYDRIIAGIKREHGALKEFLD